VREWPRTRNEGCSAMASRPPIESSMTYMSWIAQRAAVSAKSLRGRPGLADALSCLRRGEARLSSSRAVAVQPCRHYVAAGFCEPLGR
jgi:hypothetical protein